MHVRAPDGREWEVRRHMRWPRWRRAWDSENVWWDAFPLGDVPADGGFVFGLVFAILVAVVVTALIVILAPLVVFLVEAIVVVIAALALGRPWLVVASTGGPPPDEQRWLVKGAFASRRAVREVADELRRGVLAEPETFEQEPLRY